MVRLHATTLLLFIIVVCAPWSRGNGAPSLVDRAAARLAAQGEKGFGGKLSKIQLVPFKSSVPGTMKWKSATLERAGRRINVVMTSTEVLAEFPQGWVLIVEVVGTSDNDGIARHILKTLRTSVAPGDSNCVWSLFQGVLNAGGAATDSITSSIRANSRAPGGPMELSITGPDATFIFNFDADRICFTYALPGRWQGDPSWYLSEDGRGGAGLSFNSAEDLR